MRIHRETLKVNLNQKGFSFLELIIVITIITVSSALAIPSIKKAVEYLKLKSTVNVIKHQLFLARTSSVSNTAIHCGVSFNFESSPQESIVFYDDSTGTRYKYDPGIDKIIEQNKLPKSITFEKNSHDGIINDAIVFRGDGSSKYGGSVSLVSKNFSSRINVLASTGRIKVY